MISLLYTMVRRSRDRMVDGFTTTGAISAYIVTNVLKSIPAHGEMFLI
jgi:hypothetical protein